jgi:hypothetical protein
MTLKYYLYISDTKVDILFAQIPRNILKKISADLNINLGVVSVSLKEKQSEQTRYDKVKVVSDYIENHLDVGDVDHPQAYFKATVSMRWGELWYTVYFSGKTDQTDFGLGGSIKHILGKPNVKDIPENSSTPLILGVLGKLDPDYLRDFPQALEVARDRSVPLHHWSSPPTDPDMYQLEIISHSVKHMEREAKYSSWKKKSLNSWQGGLLTDHWVQNTYCLAVPFTWLMRTKEP